MQPEARAQFDLILERLMAELPDYVQKMLAELPILVEDEPSIEIQKQMGAYEEGYESDLCGLHHGIPLTERSVQFPATLPPVIMLFRGPIQRMAEEEGGSLEEEIRVTLLHEIGHHFGMNEEELERMGYG